MASPIGVGVIGSGFMGRTWCNVSGIVEDARLVAVGGGRGAPALAAELGIAHGTADEILARPDVDLVILATPPRTHVAQVAAASAAGKHVLVEKPMATEAADCRAMVAACDGAGVRLGVVSQHRFRAAPQAAMALIDAGRIGDIRMIRVFGPGSGWDIPVGSWNSDEKNVTPFVDWGAHAVDLLRWLTGSEPALVFAQYGSYTDIGPKGQSAMAQLTFANGILAQVWLTYEMPPPGMGSAMQLLISGSTGIIDLDSYGTVKLQAPDGTWATAFGQPPFDPLDPHSTIRLEAYARELRDVIAAICEGRDPWVSGRQGLHTTTVLEAADRSAATGRAMRIDDAGAHPA